MTSPDLSIVWWRMLVLWWRRFADLGICSFEVTCLIISILLGLSCRTYIVLHNILVIIIVGHLLEHLIVNVSIIYIILLLYFFSNPGARQMITIIRAHQNFSIIRISYLMNSDRLTSLLELLISLLKLFDTDFLGLVNTTGKMSECARARRLRRLRYFPIRLLLRDPANCSPILIEIIHIMQIDISRISFVMTYLIHIFILLHSPLLDRELLRLVVETRCTLW